MRTHRNIVLDPPVSSALSALAAAPVMAAAMAPPPAPTTHQMGSSMASIASVAGLGPVGGSYPPVSTMGAMPSMAGNPSSVYPSATAPHLLQLTTATAAAMAALQAARPLIVRVKRDEANASNDSSPYGVSGAMAMTMGVGPLNGTDTDVLTEVDLEDETQPGEVAEDMVSRSWLRESCMRAEE